MNDRGVSLRFCCHRSIISSVESPQSENRNDVIGLYINGWSSIYNERLACIYILGVHVNSSVHLNWGEGRIDTVVWLFTALWGICIWFFIFDWPLTIFFIYCYISLCLSCEQKLLNNTRITPIQLQTFTGMLHPPPRLHVRQKTRHQRPQLQRPIFFLLLLLPPHQNLTWTTTQPRILLPLVPRSNRRTLRLRGMSPSDILLPPWLVQTCTGGEWMFPPMC